MKRENIQKWIDLLKKVPDCRESRVKRIKEEIKRGNYITEEKLRIAINKLFKEIST